MIQDKIFFDEKDPAGLNYNTPFTVFGSYEGRLWSKAPGGEIKYYTQNSDLSVFATTGSNQFEGNQAITGSLVVTQGITGTATTASHVTYANVANKPTLVSGSSQVSFTGIINKPTLVSGSSQVSYSGITNKPSGIVSGSAQVAQFGYATTGSNQFKASQAITGSLVVTGQIVAQTLNVQQVTSSVVFSSGSNIFGNNSGNIHRFTGSLQVTGSSHYLLGSVGVGVNNPQTKLHINGALTFTEVGYNTTFKHSISNSHSNGSNPNNYLGFNISDGSGNTAERMRIDGNGNFGIGTISPASRLNVAGAKTNSGDLSNAANQLAVTDTTATAAGVGGRISFLGAYTATPDYITFGAVEVLKVNANNYGSSGWNNASMRFIVGNNDNDASAGRLLERMRITTDGEVLIGGFGTVFPVLTVKGIASSPHIGSTWSVSANQDGTGRTIIGTAGQGRSMYFENNGDIVIPNNTLEVSGQLKTSSGRTGGYIRRDSGFVNETATITENRTAYFLYKYTADANGSSTTNFNITGLSTTNGTWVDINLRVRKDATSSAINTVGTIQINGADMIGSVFASGTGAVQTNRTIRVVRMSDEWVIIGGVGSY